MTSNQISADTYWLRDLAGMGAPIQCPGRGQLNAYRRLEAGGLVEYG